MSQQKLAKGPARLMSHKDPRNFALRRSQMNCKLPGEGANWIMYREQKIIEDYIISTFFDEVEKQEKYTKNSVKPNVNNFFARRLM